MFLSRSAMHTAVDLAIQQLNSNEFEQIQPEVKDYYLNAAMDDILLETITYTKSSSLKKPFVDINDIRNRFNRLSNFLVETPITTIPIKDTTTKDPSVNRYAFSFSSSIYYYIGTRLLIQPPTVLEGGVPKEIVCLNPDLGEDVSSSNSPYGVKRLNITTTVIRLNDTLIKLLVTLPNNGCSIKELTYSYLKAPDQLSATNAACPFPHIFHTEIVDRAAKKLSAQSGNQNYQLLNNEMKD